jgi:aminoglycoside phosphotransferase (APT) family kinase protein
MSGDFLAALKAGTALPATGTAHGHVRLENGRLARVAYAHDGDASAAGRLQAQAAAFRHLAPAGRTPKLHEVVEPRAGLPGGALVVDFIAGRAPRLPGELGAMAETLARIHSLPLPPESSPIPRQANPLLETLEGIELNATRFLDKAVPDQGARAEVAEELRAVRDLSVALARQAQPLTVALADTHPGNFIVDGAGIAWFVDLEKVHVGSPAIDLAHATLPTSTLWHPDVGVLLSSDDVRAFHKSYLAYFTKQEVEALRPWIVPMRRLTWLRTTLFMARWRVETRAPRDPANTTQWSDAGLDHKMKRHIDARIDQCFERGTIRSIRSEWLAKG